MMLTIRPVSLSDAQAIQAIYAPYVEKTAITFEYEVPSVQEFENALARRLKIPLFSSRREWPSSRLCLCLKLLCSHSLWLDDRAVYLSSWRCTWSRFGKPALWCPREGTWEAWVLAFPSLYRSSERSEHFHAWKRGYVQVAHFPKIGYKFNKWHDIVWMQKTIDGPVRK